MRPTKALCTFSTAAALVLLGACGGDDADSSDSADSGNGPRSSASPSSPAAAPPVTEADLRAALLEPGDVPDGFQVDQDSTASGEEDTSDCAAIDQADDSNPDATASAQIDFTAGDQGPFIGEQLVQLRDGTAGPLMSALAAAPTACKTAVLTDAGGPVTFTVAALDVPKLGDQTVGLNLTTEVDGTPLALHLVAVQTGDLLVLTSNAGIGQADLEITRNLSRSAFAKANDTLG